MTGSGFWNSSLPEIIDWIESDNRRRKEQINYQFVLADVIANRCMRDEKTPVIHPWDLYPGLFAEEQKHFEEYQKVQEFEEYKEKRRKAMLAHNARCRGHEVIE